METPGSTAKIPDVLYRKNKTDWVSPRPAWVVFEGSGPVHLECTEKRAKRLAKKMTKTLGGREFDYQSVPGLLRFGVPYLLDEDGVARECAAGEKGALVMYTNMDCAQRMKEGKPIVPLVPEFKIRGAT